MPIEQEQIINAFKQFVEAALIEHNSQKALSFAADDVIGIGMGSQGIVYSKADLARIVGDDKSDSDSSKTEVEYMDIQARCYEQRYGTVCGVLQIKTTVDGNTVISNLGQIINFRKVDGSWLLYALQATPLFDHIEELEAYPIRFAENVLETYRQQEQIAKNAQKDSLAVYLVDFTKGTFESADLKSDLVVRTEKGDRYEEIVFNNARRRLNEEDCYKFISTFSLGNVLKAYQSGQTELSLEYEMFFTDRESVWMKTLIRLYTDKTDENLKGYLYVIDIDAAKRRELELQSKAELDPLTQLFNKKHSEMKIAEKLRAISPSKRGAFFMIDLDFFKNVNDTYGHQEGDRILRETANCITNLIRKNDIAGRLGGDEFCAYFQGELTWEIITEKAEMLCESIRNLIPKKENGTSCSIGIALCSTPGLSFEEIYHKADKALYQQKKNGRNGYTIYSD